MKLVLLITRVAGIAALLGAGVAGCGLPSSTHAQAFMANGVSAAKVKSAQASGAGGNAVNLVNSGDPSMCIDADSNHYASNGDNIQLWACNTHPEQEWVLTSLRQLKNASTGMCIDADSNHYPSNGDNIQLWACNTHPEQEWVVTSAGQLKNASTGMCIDADRTLPEQRGQYPAMGLQHPPRAAVVDHGRRAAGLGRLSPSAPLTTSPTWALRTRAWRRAESSTPD